MRPDHDLAHRTLDLVGGQDIAGTSPVAVELAPALRDLEKSGLAELEGAAGSIAVDGIGDCVLTDDVPGVGVGFDVGHDVSPSRSMASR